jgi:hypothetical protein
MASPPMLVLIIQKWPLNFSGVQVSIVWDFLLGCPKPTKIRDLQGNLSREKLFITIFKFIGQFFFQNNVLNSKKSFQSIS